MSRLFGSRFANAGKRLPSPDAARMALRRALVQLGALVAEP